MVTSTLCWSLERGQLAIPLTKAAERRAFAACDGIVTLTEKIWPIINQWKAFAVERSRMSCACCTDLELFKFSEADRQRVDRN